MYRLLLLNLVVVVFALPVSGCGESTGPNGEPAPSAEPPAGGWETPPAQNPPLETPPVSSASFEIESWEPNEGRTTGGELVVLHGDGFVEGSDVWFGSRPSQSVTVYSEKVIHARTPSHKPGVVGIRVVAPDQTERGVSDAFVFRDPVAVTSISPAEAPARGGEPVTVRGAGFTADTNVLVGGHRLIGMTVVDSTTIIGVVAPGRRGLVDILAANGLASARLADGFRYLAPPVLDTLEPASGPADGETLVTLVGAGLHSDAQVTIGDTIAGIAESTIFGTRLTVRVTGGVEGLADITITTLDGALTVLNAFVFTGDHAQETEILNVFPAEGPQDGGSVVTITAYGLSAATAVAFDDIPVDIVALDPEGNTVVVRTPPGTGAAAISVTTDHGTDVLGAGYQYLFVPKVDEVEPKWGSMEGGDTLTVSGVGLEDALEVFVGALPATILARDTDTLTLLTPPGAAGPADVRVVLPQATATAPEAFDFRPDDGPQVYAIYPDYAAIAGNTLITVYGAGFGGNAKVRFAKKYLDTVDHYSSAQLRLRAPRADEAVVVDVTVEQASWSQTLTDAFSFFDPTSPYGGSWGPAIDGTVNVTVLDLYETEPIPDTFVMLGDDPNTPFQGFTDDRGQIVFSGPEIAGPQMVTAAKAAHTAYSVVEYDAENVTIHLIPLNPSSSSGGGGGGGGPDDLLATLNGRVTGLGKYVVTPEGVTGRKTAYCQSTTPGPWESAPKPNTPGSQADVAWTDDAGDFWMTVHLSELAVVCIGGIVQDEAVPLKSFMPLMMGVARHIQASSGETMPGLIEVPLTIPLSRDVPLRLDGAPLTYVNPATGIEGPTDTRLQIALDFASSGFWTTADLSGVGTDRFLLEAQPQSLTGDLDGVTYYVEAEVQGKGNQSAVSGTRAGKIKLEETDKVMHFVDGTWSDVEAGIPNDVNGLWSSAQDSVWGVGANGLIVHGKAQAWFPQYSPVETDLHSVWGASADHALAVGSDGAIVAFDGAVWSQESSGTSAGLFAVTGSAADNAWAVGDHVLLHRNGTDWTVLDGAPTVLRAAVAVSATSLYAAGDDGKLWVFELTGGASGTWTAHDLALSGVALHGIAYDSATGTIWLVGDQGTVVVWDEATATGSAWDVPTTERLRAVVVVGGAVFAAGDRGVLLRFDGNGWSMTRAPGYGGDLRALAGAGGLSGTVAAGTREIALGPMLDFPHITSPVAPMIGGQSAFDYKVSWTVRGGTLPTFNFVEMMMGFGNYFPAWWAVVEANTQDVAFPNLPADKSINPFLDGNAVMFVHRVYKPGASADNFDFWDTWNKSTWTSWSSAVVPFTP